MSTHRRVPPQSRFPQAIPPQSRFPRLPQAVPHSFSPTGSAVHQRLYYPPSVPPCTKNCPSPVVDSPCTKNCSTPPVPPCTKDCPSTPGSSCHPNFAGAALTLSTAGGALSWSAKPVVGNPLGASPSPSKFFFQQNGFPIVSYTVK